MNWKLTLLELLLAGFFAVACIRAGGMLSLERKRTLSDFFRLSNRLERLRRSRWQWLWEASDFVRKVRLRMRFGEMSRLPLRLLRLELGHETAVCEWVARAND